MYYVGSGNLALLFLFLVILLCLSPISYSAKTIL